MHSGVILTNHQCNFSHAGMDSPLPTLIVKYIKVDFYGYNLKCDTFWC